MERAVPAVVTCSSSQSGCSEEKMERQVPEPSSAFLRSRLEIMGRGHVFFCCPLVRPVRGDALFVYQE